MGKSSGGMSGGKCPRPTKIQYPYIRTKTKEVRAVSEQQTPLRTKELGTTACVNPTKADLVLSVLLSINCIIPMRDGWWCSLTILIWRRTSFWGGRCLPPHGSRSSVAIGYFWNWNPVRCFQRMFWCFFSTEEEVFRFCLRSTQWRSFFFWTPSECFHHFVHKWRTEIKRVL